MQFIIQKFVYISEGWCGFFDLYPVVNKLYAVYVCWRWELYFVVSSGLFPSTFMFQELVVWQWILHVQFPDAIGIEYLLNFFSLNWLNLHSPLYLSGCRIHSMKAYSLLLQANYGVHQFFIKYCVCAMCSLVRLQATEMHQSICGRIKNSLFTWRLATPRLSSHIMNGFENEQNSWKISPLSTCTVGTCVTLTRRIN